MFGIFKRLESLENKVSMLEKGYVQVALTKKSAGRPGFSKPKTSRKGIVDGLTVEKSALILMKETGRVYSIKTIASLLKVKRQTVAASLSKMYGEGKVDRPYKGHYTAKKG